MPVCEKCNGAGSVVRLSDGSLVPFYEAPESVCRCFMRCKRCDGYGRVPEEKEENA